VAAFLAGGIRFTDIHRVNAGTIEAVRPGAGTLASVDDLLELDRRARRHAAGLVAGLRS